MSLILISRSGIKLVQSSRVDTDAMFCWPSKSPWIPEEEMVLECPGVLLFSPVLEFVNFNTVFCLLISVCCYLVNYYSFSHSKFWTISIEIFSGSWRHDGSSFGGGSPASAQPSRDCWSRGRSASMSRFDPVDLAAPEVASIEWRWI